MHIVPDVRVLIRLCYKELKLDFVDILLHIVFPLLAIPDLNFYPFLFFNRFRLKA